MDIAQEIGAKIRYYRKQQHMTVDQLALAVGKSKSSISKYEQGQIVIDILSLYAIAEALNVKVTQLLYLPLAAYTAAPSGTIPAFFAGMNHFFMYYYDGRTNQVTRSVLDITSGSEPGVFHVQMFMNVHDYDHYQLCENYYDGILTHYDALSLLVFQNMNTTTKWALAYGISSRPLMPTSTKVLLSKTIQQETPEFKKSLRLSKEDFRLMKLYNMLTVF